MLVNAVVYTFPADKMEEAARLLAAFRQATLREEGCLGYEVVRGENDHHGTVLLLEKWRDQAALDAHTGEEHFERLCVNGYRLIAASRQQIKGTLLE